MLEETTHTLANIYYNVYRLNYLNWKLVSSKEPIKQETVSLD